MAAHHRVRDYACCHLQADCLESGISSGPLRSISSMGNLYLYLVTSHLVRVTVVYECFILAVFVDVRLLPIPRLYKTFSPSFQF